MRMHATENDTAWLATDSLVQAAVAEHRIPGAVVAYVSPEGATMRAYGYRQLVPDSLPMRSDAQFDLASLSKSVATSMAVLRLVEDGRVQLTDTLLSPHIRVQDYLTHTSGLPAYVSPQRLRSMDMTILQYIQHCADKVNPTDEKVFRYSCLNYVALQYIVERVTQMPLNRYVEDSIFLPLGMMSSCYYPLVAQTQTQAQIQAQSQRVIVPTEVGVSPYIDSLGVMRYVVHDPLAREANGGVSGNAGVFSTAADLVLLTQWMLGLREVQDSVLTLMQRHALWLTIPEGYEPFGRTLGWDRSSDYAGCKGHYAGEQAICHTGYTGTSIVIDPERRCALILLTNRVHPEDKGGVAGLRKAVADVFFTIEAGK